MAPFFPWHQSLPMNTRLNSEKNCKEVCNPANVKINSFAVNITVNEASTLK